MLSYRHSFHAGNYADVLKHSLWLYVLQYLGKKEKPYCVIDTHAGAGQYRLDSDEALKLKEYSEGISLLYHADPLPALLSDYVAQVKGINPDGELTFYPGSPLLVLRTLRKQDKAFFHELHSSELPLLKNLVKDHRSASVIGSDGFINLSALLPPQARRGAILMDPSYEVKTDYDEVISALIRGVRRFATGIFMIWYPVVERRRITGMIQKLIDSGIPDIQQYELCITADTEGRGMTGCGLFVVNAPWGMQQAFEEAAPDLKQLLCRTEGSVVFRQLVPEA